MGRHDRSETEIPPRASAVVESLRDLGYSLETALADVIDNSLAAGANKIELVAETHEEDPAIGILDNGTGMTEAELLEAMRPGSKSPLEERTAEDLGRFGLGLKTASFSQCRRFTVVTSKAGVLSCAVWDLDVVAKRDKWVIEHPNRVDEIRWADRLTDNGTLVVWEKLDRLVGPSSDRGDLVRQLARAARHIEFVFHRFLSGREAPQGSVKVFLNGGALEAFDPFHSHHPATQHHQEEILKLDGQQIRIRPMTLPHHNKVSRADWEKYGQSEGYVKSQGFYLYRNLRLIVHGTWFGLARQQELTKLSRVCIDIPNSLDVQWKIDVKKASAQPPPVVRKRLRKIIERIGVPSRRTYTRRGTRLAEDSQMPVWQRIQDKNRISYSLNTGHPLLAAFNARLGQESEDEFKKIVSLINSTLPVESLYADVSASPESVEPESPDAETFKGIVEAVWCTLRESGLSSAKVTAYMRSADPFRTRWDDAEKVVQLLEAESRAAQ